MVNERSVREAQGQGGDRPVGKARGQGGGPWARRNRRDGGSACRGEAARAGVGSDARAPHV